MKNSQITHLQSGGCEPGLPVRQEGLDLADDELRRRVQRVPVLERPVDVAHCISVATHASENGRAVAESKTQRGAIIRPLRLFFLPWERGKPDGLVVARQRFLQRACKVGAK